MVCGENTLWYDFLVANCWFSMYFIKKYFTVFLIISQFAKNGVDDILTFMQLTCTINGTKIVIHIQFKYSLIAFSTTRLFSTKKQPFLSMLVHMHDFQSFPQLKISFFTSFGFIFSDSIVLPVFQLHYSIHC